MNPKIINSYCFGNNFTVWNNAPQCNSATHIERWQDGQLAIPRRRGIKETSDNLSTDKSNIIT